MIIPSGSLVVVQDNLFLVKGFVTDHLLFVAAQKDCSGSLKPTSSGTREMARFGVPYTYKGNPLPSTPFANAPGVNALCELVKNALQTDFNAAVINRYATGEHHLPHHSDTRAIPQLGKEPVIAGISWGSSRVFEFKGKKKDSVTHQVVQEPGDLVVMHGGSQRFFTHGVPVAPGCVLPRWSVTFRFHQ